MGRASNRGLRPGDIDLSLWEEFLKAKSGSTARNYREAVRFFIEACGFKGLEDAAARAEEKHVVSFIRYLRDKGLSPKSVRLYYHGVKAFLELFDRPVNWGRVANLLPPKRGVRMGEAVPKNVVEAVLERIPNPTKRLAIWLIWATGLRIGEALSIKARDIDFGSNPPKLTVVTEKTHEPREIPLPSDVAEALKRHVSSLRPEDYVFHPSGTPSKPLGAEKLRKAFRAALIRAGRPEKDKSGRGWRYTPHGLRRSYESNLVRAGVYPMVVALLLGHRVGVEQHYLRLTYKDIVAEWRKAEPYLILKEAYPADLESRVAALEEALKVYENIIDKLAKKFPNLLRALDLEE